MKDKNTGIEYILDCDKNTVITIPEMVDIITPRGRIMYRQFQVDTGPYIEVAPENTNYFYERTSEYFVFDSFKSLFMRSLLGERIFWKIEHNVEKPRIYEIINKCSEKNWFNK